MIITTITTSGGVMMYGFLLGATMMYGFPLGATVMMAIMIIMVIGITMAIGFIEEIVTATVMMRKYVSMGLDV